MKIEDNTLTLLIILIIALTVSAITIKGCESTEKTKQEAIKAGLIQTNQPGTSTTMWVKPEEAKK